MTALWLYREPRSERQCSARRLYRRPLPCPRGLLVCVSRSAPGIGMPAGRADPWVTLLTRRKPRDRNNMSLHLSPEVSHNPDARRAEFLLEDPGEMFSSLLQILEAAALLGWWPPHPFSDADLPAFSF
uniref:Uncharacterized protein n=1 Tax=Pipistrellus kuhlii TaxID=59472 RepID=A0A7J7XVI0_PIPKU|nr:hypothetical protein mPipKuh1_010507 [Pipistrellus kuhlii]